jgi:hypothetical protein
LLLPVHRRDERLGLVLVGRPARTLVGAFADIADTLPEATLGLVEVGFADAVGWREVVKPAQEIWLVGFVEVGPASRIGLATI